jgi:putative FmdB family regulatory protein
MPTYLYFCKYCKEFIEKDFKISEYQDEIECGCGGSAKRSYSPTYTLYKTSGFYTTDSKGK